MLVAPVIPHNRLFPGWCTLNGKLVGDGRLHIMT